MPPVIGSRLRPDDHAPIIVSCGQRRATKAANQRVAKGLYSDYSGTAYFPGSMAQHQYGNYLQGHVALEFLSSHKGALPNEICNATTLAPFPPVK